MKQLLFFIIVILLLLVTGCATETNEQETIEYTSIVLERSLPEPTCTDTTLNKILEKDNII